VVMVVVGLEADQTSIREMRDLRNRIVRICRRFDVGPFPIEARTLDSRIIVRGRRIGTAEEQAGVDAAGRLERPATTVPVGTRQ